MRRGTQFHPNIVIVQRNGVIADLDNLRIVRIPRPIPLFRTVGRPPESMQLPYGRNDQKISQIPVPADSAHMNETEPFQRIMMPGIAGTVISPRPRIRTQLHQSERSRASRKSLSQTMTAASRFRRSGSAYNRPNIRYDIFRLGKRMSSPKENTKQNARCSHDSVTINPIHTYLPRKICLKK